MKIAILGTGPIGSTFAFHLARSGHDVTVIARNQRLAQLQADQAIVTVGGERAPVTVLAELDAKIEYDLVLVTVLASGVDAVLPALRASAAKSVMFMFNTFASLAPLENAVGRERFSFGFPGILAFLPDGKLKFEVLTRGQTTVATDAKWAKVFSDAGIVTSVEKDMQSWLRTHAVMIVAMMSMACVVYQRKSGVTWSEARKYVDALHEGFTLVEKLGGKLTPSAMGMLNRMPTAVVTGLFWSASRLSMIRDIGSIGPGEPRALIEAMTAVAPDGTAALRAIRP